MKYDAFIPCAIVPVFGAFGANLSNIASEPGLMGNRCCVANVLETHNRNAVFRFAMTVQ